ncbi:BPSS1780 family membrane protein [Castellaniella sp. GW247-6E4]|uniref:BPSS1780 family membrane protein n=1 Tax=Castellaniella sp. GW247-6E4 TaxID=3140380 RepID=UPI003314D5C0
MQAAILPVSAGWSWIAQGYDLFRRQPLAMFFWSVLTSFIIMLASAIPLLGQLALIAFTPLLTFLTLCACRNIDRGVRMLPGMWLQPLQAPGVSGRLTRLGLAYLAGSLAAALIATLPFVSTLAGAIDDQGQINYAAMAAAMRGPLVVFGVLYLLLSALFWHAPALIGWHRVPLARALFYSMVACWRNKWGFLLYAASWVGLFYGLQAIVDMLVAAGVSTGLLQWILVPANILVAAVLYCSFYPAYVMIFESRSDWDNTSSQSGSAQ